MSIDQNTILNNVDTQTLNSTVAIPTTQSTTVLPSTLIRNLNTLAVTTVTTVQEFLSTGGLEPTSLSDTQKADNNTKIVNGSPILREPPVNSSESTVVTKDTVALKQKGDLHEDGASGDQDLKKSGEAFKAAVGTAAGLNAAGLALKALTPNSRPRDPVNNYYLTNSEKTLLQKRANELAVPGIIPYDALEEFLYVLCTISEYEDLRYISTVVGIPEFDDRDMVRNPSKLLNVRELYKIGYLANGVCALTKQFSTNYYNASYAADSQSSTFGALLGVASFSSSPLGSLSSVIGIPAAVESLGLTGADATAAIATLTSAASISQFPGINIISSLVNDIASQLATTTAITNLLGTPAGFGGIAGQIAQLSTVSSQLASTATQTLNVSTVIANQGIASAGPLAASMMSLAKNIRSTSFFTNQLSSVTTLAATAAKCGDVNSQLSKISTMTASLATSVASITSAISAITGPGNISSAAAILQRTGGFSTSSLLAQMTLGQSVPTSVLFRNPMMQPPSYAGRAFFGEGMTPGMAIDQMFCRRIASFPTNPSGSGLMSFQMQNFGSYGGGMSITNMLSLATLGLPIAPTTGALGTQIASLASSVASIMGGSTTSIVDARRSDNAIPFMIAASSAMVNDTKCPFSTSVFSSGWRHSCSVGNEVQKYSPLFLATAISSL